MIRAVARSALFAGLARTAAGESHEAQGQLAVQNPVNVYGLYCPLRNDPPLNTTATEIQIDYEGLDVAQPHIITIMRNFNGAITLGFNVMDATGMVVVADTEVELMAITSRRLEEEIEVGGEEGALPSFLTDSSRRRYSAPAPRPAPRPTPPSPAPRPTPPSPSPTAAAAARRRGTPSSSPTPRPTPRPTPSPSPSPASTNARRRGTDTPSRPPPTPPPPSSAGSSPAPMGSNTPASSAPRRRTATGAPTPPGGQSNTYQGTSGMGQGQTNYGYGNQQQMNNNYGGNRPQQSGYGYSGGNAYAAGSNRRYGTGAMVGAVVAGAVVGAGAMYMYQRMNTYSPRMQQRLQSAGARSSDLTISLMWDSTDNLDLQVLPPSPSREINAQNRGNARSASGGWLDTDANNWGLGTSEPIENCMFDQPQEGRYEVRVRFDDCTGLCGDNIAYEVVVRAAVTLSDQSFQEGVRVLDQSDYGTILAYNGVMTRSGQTDGVMSFTVSDVPVREWCVAPANTVRAGELMDCSECNLLVAGGASSWEPATPAPPAPPPVIRDGASSTSGSSPGPSSGAGRLLAELEGLEFVDKARRLQTCSPCNGAQCDVPLPAAMARDDIMSAMVIPARYTAPLTVSITSLSGPQIPAGICDIPPTASVQMMVSLTQLDQLPDPDSGAGVCDKFLNTPCNADTQTRCYNNEMCTGSVCECDTESCLEGNECLITDSFVEDDSAAIAAVGFATGNKLAMLLLCFLAAMFR